MSVQPIAIDAEELHVLFPPWQDRAAVCLTFVFPEHSLRAVCNSLLMHLHAARHQTIPYIKLK